MKNDIWASLIALILTLGIIVCGYALFWGGSNFFDCKYF